MCGTRKLKILFISSDKYPPMRPAARAIFSEEFVRRGHVVDWILQQERHQAKFRCERYGHGVAYIAGTDDGHSKWHRLKKHILDSLNDLRIFGLSRSNRYDVIQVKDKYLGALMGLAAARITATPFCFWLAYPHPEASLYSARKKLSRYPLLNFIKGIVYRFVLYKIVLLAANHIFVQSEQMKADIAKEGIPEEKMTPVPGSVNLATIPYKSGLGQKMGSGADKERRIVYLGTMMRVRRLDFLIRVVYEVRKTHPTAKLYMVGKGEMSADDAFLQAEVERLGMTEAVVFTGFLPMNQAWEYIRAADVCVSPYFPTPILNSTSPTKLIEYMAMGKAVVANDHPEQSLVIAESNGGICVPWDEKAFAGAIGKILDDSVLAVRMGENGRRFVESRRTNEHMADIVEAEYSRLCRLEGREAIKNPCTD